MVSGSCMDYILSYCNQEFTFIHMFSCCNLGIVAPLLWKNTILQQQVILISGELLNTARAQNHTAQTCEHN